MGNYDKWLNTSMPAELSFHQRNKWRQSDDFYKHSDDLFKEFLRSYDEYKDKNVLDAGCGSKLRTALFNSSRLFGIDPLLKDFSEIEGSDLNTGLVKGFSLPLETLVLELKGEMDLVVCVNVIDHCYDWEKCLENIMLYLKHEGKLFLYFDINRKVEDQIHNTISQEEVKDFLSKYGYIEEEFTRTKGFDKGCNMLGIKFRKD